MSDSNKLSTPSDERSRDRYERYRTLGEKPKNHLSNYRNIFDESNYEDKRWLEKTLDYMAGRA